MDLANTFDHRFHADTGVPTDVLKNGFSGPISVYGKSVHTDISMAAVKAITNRDLLMVAEMELYFSCLIRKRVLFHELESEREISHDLAHVFPGLFIRFCAVCTKECRGVDVVDKPPLTTMPVKNLHSFVPRWLRIDLRQKRLCGEYGIV